MLTAIPNHERLIPAMRHYDLIGFQADRDALNFTNYLKDECGIANPQSATFCRAGRALRIGAFPVGIETAALSRLARRAVHSSFVRGVVESLAGRDMIIGVDRLDYSKGIALRMEAFDRFSLGQSRPARQGDIFTSYAQKSLGDSGIRRHVTPDR
jgi:trehalose 6-phosphate synthase